MLDTTRMRPFLEQIEELWNEVPYLRFGQLMYNFLYELGDPYYWKEEEFLEKLRGYIQSLEVVKVQENKQQ